MRNRRRTAATRPRRERVQAARLADPTALSLPRPLVESLLRLYDVPDPRRPGRVIRGYDRPHALRTARMCRAVAMHLGHSPVRVAAYETACLLHDLGRAGLDRRLFGAIWSWARRQGIPTRPREWRAVHPETRYGRETEAFLARHGHALEQAGIRMDEWAAQQVEMRLGYARRLARRLRDVRPQLMRLGLRWQPWMTRVLLYYYYPEKMTGAPSWVRELGEILVACEQFEAYSNRRRGQDYYARSRETVTEAFAYLEKLRVEGILSETVVQSLRGLGAAGVLDGILEDARGGPLPPRERNALRRPGRSVTACR